ncbi:transcriptional factor B3 family protein [Prunus dulcis]|uniref:Transcriptional factor B3 family protein n=1 Tax=Prunus dulcis TaxID=3755 RepID=A0A5H2XSF0_PRUDU|nr:transcriptional factor B3 family protein [Prunus dulcis]
MTMQWKMELIPPAFIKNFNRRRLGKCTMRGPIMLGRGTGTETGWLDIAIAEGLMSYEGILIKETIMLQDQTGRSCLTFISSQMVINCNVVSTQLSCLDTEHAGQEAMVSLNSRKRKRKEKKPQPLNHRERAADQCHQEVRPFFAFRGCEPFEGNLGPSTSSPGAEQSLVELGRRIPPAFIKNFNGRRLGKCTMRGPTGKCWAWNWNRDGWLFFHKGWPGFVKDHFIESEDFLIFDYDGGSVLMSPSMTKLVARRM